MRVLDTASWLITVCAVPHAPASLKREQVTMVDTHTGDKQDLRLCPGDVFKAMVLREGSSMQRVIKPITDAKLFRLTRRRFLRHVTGSAAPRALPPRSLPVSCARMETVYDGLSDVLCRPAMQLVGNESGFLMTTRGGLRVDT